MKNAYCEALSIEVPNLDRVSGHGEANTFSLLIVALLERGKPMTLADVATRFAEAGIAPPELALQSLRRCRPARAPVYRDGDHYSLDPHDDDLDLWVFRLGLKAPRVVRLKVVRPEPEPLPTPDVPLQIAELNQAWKDASLNSWSSRRLALAVLDASQRAMHPQQVLDFVAARTRWHALRCEATQSARRGSAIKVLPDGRWSISPDADQALTSTRRAVREQVAAVRRRLARGPDPSVLGANQKAAQRRRAAHAAQLAKMRRGLIYAFPTKHPQAAALVDVAERKLETFVGEELHSLCHRLVEFEILGAVEIRALLRALRFDHGERRLAELGPPQKTKRLNRRGRTLKLTAELLIQGSCGISRPFGDEQKLLTYLRDGREAKLRRRLKASVKSLFALHEYGRLHGAVRLRWGFLDEFIPAPWVHRDEPTLHELKQAAVKLNVPLEVVAGSAPGWNNPWARARPAYAEQDPRGWGTLLIDEHGYVFDYAEIQLARLATAPP